MGLEEALAIYLVAVIIPAGPHVAAPDPSLAWALPCAQRPNEAVISEGESTGPGSPGNCLSGPPWGWCCLKAPPRTPLFLGPKSGSGQILLEWPSSSWFQHLHLGNLALHEMKSPLLPKHPPLCPFIILITPVNAYFLVWFPTGL